MECESGALQRERERMLHSPEDKPPTLTDLPAACLHLICQFLEDDNTKNAALRTCHVLRSAVLDSCMALLQLDCMPSQEENEEEQQDKDMKHQQQAQVLQQAKRVALLFEFGDGDDCLEGQAIMYAWLGEMYYQCKGPLVSVCKVALQGKPTPVSTLPTWLHVYCPNVVHLDVDNTSGIVERRCNMDVMAARVFRQLKSVEMRFKSYEHIAAIMSALLEAPHLTHVALSLRSPLPFSYADNACQWKTLHMLDYLALPDLAQLPKKGVEHLVLGSYKACWFKLKLATSPQGGQRVDHAKIIKDAFTELDHYPKVTLSTDGGLLLDCNDVSAADALLVLPLLKRAKPYRLSSDSASGTLTIDGLQTVTLEFVQLLCSTIPSTITRLAFIEPKRRVQWIFGSYVPSKWVWEEGVLEQLVSLMPAHVTAFTLFSNDDVMSWEHVRIACEHATRKIVLAVPSYRYYIRVRPIRLHSLEGDVMAEWQVIEQSMQGHGHQHVTMKQFECVYF